MKANLMAEEFQNEDKAREYLEKMRWTNGVACPHCGSVDAYRLEAGDNHRWVSSRSDSRYYQKQYQEKPEVPIVDKF